MVLGFEKFICIGVLCFAFLLLGCTEVEYDNPYDPNNPNAIVRYSSSVPSSSSSVEPSSSSEAESSSSVAFNSSSVEPSSSSTEPSSSSTVPSSSSAVPSSSSAESSSSSEAESSSSVVSSSSSIEPSSSSAEPNSSSEAESSSSIAPSSSSVVPCTASDNNETQYCSEGTMKEYGFVTHGGQTYKTVVIGTQTWMAENLNAPKSGTFFPCSEYDCSTYGRLYDWVTAKTVCPSGWHLPTNAEWEIMTDYIGGADTEGKKLKTTTGWNDYQGKFGNGTDEYGFSALPGGSGGSFSGVGNHGFWWSASEIGSNYAYYRSMNGDNENAYWGINYKSGLFSVRCLQD